MSTSAALRTTLKRITDELAALIAQIPVRRFDRSGGVIVVCPDYFWQDLTAEQSNVQLKIKRDFESWLERVKIMFRGSSEEVQYELQQAEAAFNTWIELDHNNWELTPDRAQNESHLRNDAAAFEKLTNILDPGKGSHVILVPDTNAIVKEPDPTQYRGLVGSDTFTFLLLPTVLSELDKLKNHHRNPDFRDKADKVVTRIKGWRKQGSLSTGVTVDKTIQVRALHNEPNMKNTLSWLDPYVLDDRIIASLLEVQTSNPADRVILLTGDINLQNKADATAIEHLEL